MGLTSQSTGLSTLKEMYEVQVESPEDVVIALAGNPNTGKSTVFNSLTGLKQHTGNWPGKTVTNAQGRYRYKDKNYILIDLPGTYSLLASSVEEEVARDFICFGNAHGTVVVVDATCLERNLNLVLQILEMTNNVVVCVNLMDEAKRKKIKVDLQKLSKMLGVPVVGTSARSGQGLTDLKEQVELIAAKPNFSQRFKVKYPDSIEQAIEILKSCLEQLIGDGIDSRWAAIRLLEEDSKILKSLEKYFNVDLKENAQLNQTLKEAKKILINSGLSREKLRDFIVSSIVKTAEDIARQTVSIEDHGYSKVDRRIDDILTSKTWGIPIMIALLGLVFWLTIQGANYPSELLSAGLFWIEDRLTAWFTVIGAPDWLHGAIVLGMYRTLAWVVSVMLPPMAIFFPLFTLLEDLGYLPRVAFNLDNFFKKACAHGKQALTMCMGFGCNAAGVIACRIIDSTRERMIATITNNYVPCNGRFPILISLATIFIAGSAGVFKSVIATLAVLGTIVLGVVITLIVSRILSRTILKGLPSSFMLELPPYRKPQVGRILVRSLLDRTLFVLARAITVTAPAGLIIWSMANVSVAGISLLDHAAGFLDPFAYWLGLDGYILTAFILGLPANEIVIPIIIMSYMSTGVMVELDSLDALRELLVNNGWTWLTAVCTMLFSLNHFPCATTLLTIRKETQSMKWTGISFLVPTITGIIICFIVAQTARIFGLV